MSYWSSEDSLSLPRLIFPLSLSPLWFFFFVTFFTFRFFTLTLPLMSLCSVVHPPLVSSLSSPFCILTLRCVYSGRFVSPLSVSTAVCPSFFLCCEGRRYEKKSLLWGTVRRLVPPFLSAEMGMLIFRLVWRDIESQGERCHRNPTIAEFVVFAFIPTQLQTFRRFNCIQ